VLAARAFEQALVAVIPARRFFPVVFLFAISGVLKERVDLVENLKSGLRNHTK